MAEREYHWTGRGRLSARRNGLALAEAIEALYSPRQAEYRTGPTLIFVIGLIPETRLVTVVIERTLSGVALFAILGARPANSAEHDFWRRHNP